MKAATGHGSDRVLQRYVDNTNKQKMNALASKPSSSKQKKQAEEMENEDANTDNDLAPTKYIRHGASSSSSSRTVVYKPPEEGGNTNINLTLSNVTAPVTIQVGASSKAVLGQTKHATQQFASTENTMNTN